MLTIHLDKETIQNLIIGFRHDIRDCIAVDEPFEYIQLIINTLEASHNGNVCITDLEQLDTILHELERGYMDTKEEYTDFCDDEEKMRDFCEISKEEFLSSYSYLTEKEYDLTMKKVLAMGKAVRKQK